MTESNSPPPPSGFEVFDHTADVGIHAWAPDAAELARQTALGMLSLIADPAMVRPREVRELTVTGADDETRMMAWLKAVLALFNVDGFLTSEIEILPADDVGAGAAAGAGDRIRARVRGEPFDPARHAPDMEVKAVTWHQFAVTPPDRAAGGTWDCRVIVDI